MSNEQDQYLDANDCLRRASECRQKADQPGADRVKMLEMAEGWELWAKIRRRQAASAGAITRQVAPGGSHIIR